MSKYYKAEDVINAIENKIAEYIPTLYGRYNEIPLELRMAIEHLPTIDIVYCKACRHRYDDGWLEPRWTCKYKDMRLKDNDFCSYGERIEE